MQKHSSWLFFWLSITCVHDPCSMSCFCKFYICFVSYFFICLNLFVSYLYYVCDVFVLFCLLRREFCTVHCMVWSSAPSDFFQMLVCMVDPSSICSQCAIWSQVFGIKSDVVLVFSALAFTFDSAIPRKSVRNSWSFVMDQRLCHSSFCFWLDMHLSW